eukprot:1602103-Prymnesium_polylepis.1
MVDESILRIIVEEALSNARKHRRAGSTIEVRATVRTDELLIEVRNLLPLAAAPLSEEECARAFIPGVKVRLASPSSDGVGLDSVLLCANAAGGLVELRSASAGAREAPHVTFRAVLPAVSVTAVDDGVEAAPMASEPDSPNAQAGGQQPSTSGPPRASPTLHSLDVNDEHPTAAASSSAAAAASVGASPSTAAAAPVEHAVETEAEDELSASVRLLVVDDQRVNRKLLVNIFRRIGKQWAVSEASSGEEALQRILERSEEYDLILMDEHFGDAGNLFGTDVVRQLRAVGVRIPIVCCSANAGKDPSDPINARFWEAGADL